MCVMFVSPSVISVGNKPCIFPVANISIICKLYHLTFQVIDVEPNFTRMRKEKERNWHSSEPSNFGGIFCAVYLYEVIIGVLFLQV